MSNEEIYSRGFIPLSMLQSFHRDWTIKTFVLCRGSIELYNTLKVFEKIWKIILVDDKVWYVFFIIAFMFTLIYLLLNLSVHLIIFFYSYRAQECKQFYSMMQMTCLRRNSIRKRHIWFQMDWSNKWILIQRAQVNMYAWQELEWTIHYV